MINLQQAAAYFGDITPVGLRNIINKKELKIYKENRTIKIPNSTMAELNDLRGITYEPKVITVGMQKGGVGKTTVSGNLAAGAARVGLKVLCLDFDPECCLSQFLFKGEIPENPKTVLDVMNNKLQIVECAVPTEFDGIDILPAMVNIRRVERIIQDMNPAKLLKARMIGVKEKYDLILIDVPPTWNKLTSSAYISSDIVLMPVNSDVFSLDSLRLTIDDIEYCADDYSVPLPIIKILKNKYGEKRRNSRDLDDELTEYGSKVIPRYIKSSALIEDCINESKSVYDSNRKEYVLFTDSFDEVLSNLSPRMES